MIGPGGIPLPPQPNMNTPIEPLRRPQEGGGGILGALGINLSPEQRASLGAGLSSVGQNWNKPGLAAAAGSAGAAIQGGQKQEQEEDILQLKRQAQQFQQTSAAFNDLMKAYSTGSAVDLNKKRGDWFASRNDANVRNGSQWDNPNHIAINVEDQVLRFADQERKFTETKLKARGIDSGPEWDAAEAQIKARVDQHRQMLYQQHGLNPVQGQMLANMGLAPPQIKGPDGKMVPNPNFMPFDARTMSASQFHQDVPLNAYYRNVDGKIYRRSEPPPSNAAYGTKASTYGQSGAAGPFAPTRPVAHPGGRPGPEGQQQQSSAAQDYEDMINAGEPAAEG
jgi:hypothetical protein